jgi:hypothetical protein
VFSVGCSDLNAPPLQLEPQSTPFYLYQGNPIYLGVDSLRLTVEADAARLANVAALQQVLGVTVDSVTMLSPVINNWVLWLHASTSAAAAVEAARRLRAASFARFASNAYYVPDATPSCALLLVNRLAVRYRPGTTEQQIADLHQRNGLVLERRPSGAMTSWLLRYPVRSRYTPLEVAAALYRHPYVEWADPDMISCWQAF